MIRKIAPLAAACALTFAVPSAGYCIDGVAVEYGRGDDRTSLVRVAITDKWRKAQPPAADVWRLASYWEFSAALWDNRDESTADLGFTPVFRLERGRLYVEGALGFHLVQARISAARVFGTAFQFAEHVGAGFHSGKYSFGLHVQHLSNGGIRDPNPGINFVLVRLRYDLE